MAMRTDGEPKTLLEGTELSTFCPHCHQALNVFDPATKEVWVRLTVTDGGQKGELLLSPKLDVFERQVNVELVEGRAVDDIGCPHCGQSLVEQRVCEECGAPAARLVIYAQGRLVDFSICTKAGCHWHGISRADQAKIKPKVQRQKKPEQDAMLRTRNFNEVSYGLDRELAMIEASRCLECKKPACVAGCPVEVDIPGFIKHIKAGEFVEAARLIKQKNALPAVCGRVCPQDDQCEKVCLVGKKGDPVAIGNLERFAADFERETDQITIPRKPTPTGKRIAVVGSGPAGLTLAADMVAKGHSVTVFESLHKPGGVLVYGIPEFRLPKSIVDAEIDYLRRLGVKFEMNSIVGRLYTLDELFDVGYDAIFVGTGAGLPVFMNVPGENLCNILSANEYLTRVNLMKAYAFPEYDTPAPRGRQVAVLGAGNVAMDCARTALRMGAREVSIIYRRTRDEMPARTEEIEHAEQEGVKFRFLTNPIRFMGDERHRVKQIECVQMQLGEPDASGRPRPVPLAGSNFIMDIDLVIVAVGAGPNPLLFMGSPDLARTERGYIKALTPSGRTNVPQVWAGGDIVTGSATVILAMGAARRAADDMDAYLRDGHGDWLADEETCRSAGAAVRETVCVSA
jgi:glutamate synthase (NADPH) small chain